MPTGQTDRKKRGQRTNCLRTSPIHISPFVLQ